MGAEESSVKPFVVVNHSVGLVADWRTHRLQAGGGSVEPLDNESIFARFLAEKGEVVHYIAVRTPNFEETVAMEAKRGKELPLSCTYSGIKIAYLATDRDLGVLIEILSGLPNGESRSNKG